ncbi:MAG: hypothetical protein J7K57_08905 [Palaeococcus sp.]|nr:hypothetical protein [Palaeococcus sp. (in: euryarchaeotes)]MCD6559963.1 hypothetical protein [Palaeococcus sp. (in: euryarchaeotes)]
MAPSILWGFAHILNIVAEMSPLESLLLGIYVALFAFFTYYLAFRKKSLKLPIFMWLLEVVI